MPGGRPTKYEPGFGEVVIERMSQGFSKTAVAGFLQIARSTFYQWEEDHPEFSDAVKIGEAARTFKLEQDLLAAPDGPTVTSRIFALKNAAPEEWKDKREHDHTSSDGSMRPQVIQFVAAGENGEA